MQLGPSKGQFDCENNVDVGTDYYGTCEARTDDLNSFIVPGKLSPIDLVFKNNVSARKGDVKGSYTTAIALIPILRAGTSASVTNNVSCENVHPGTNNLVAWTVNGTLTQSGNQVLTSCAGVIDPITGKPI